jgi:alkanesulfonate monooxygenase SsuD/methylene tetrahydromethanopterin reductase-like flavin-dependent oxidoreductase (luciferase family)
MIMRELGYVIHADAYNWKYAWIGEHHSLTEYSHMSAPEVVFGWIAAQTERIHLGSGIMNLSRPVNHPVRNAERVAMLDHITEGRYEWGSGRGAGSHEMATFDLLTSETKAMWDEAAHEILRMWEQKDYTFEGEYFRVSKPHNILPKPYGKGHPPIWVGCGNPGTFTKAGELGIGAIAFNFEPIHNLKGRIDAYKEGIAGCTEPLGQYMNNNVMMTNAVVCVADRTRARQIAMSSGRGYLNTMVNMYHDTMPPQKNAVLWPNAPFQIPDEQTLDFLIEQGYLLCGNPDEVNEQIEKYQDVGCDQLVFGIPNEGFEHEEVLEMLELFGTKVIPNFDTDPVHSTTRYRETAQRKYPDFAHPLPEGIDVSVIPTNALLPLGG